MAEAKKLIPFGELSTLGKVKGYCDGKEIYAPPRFKHLKKKHMNFSTVRSALASEAKMFLEQAGDFVPDDVDPFAYMILKEIAGIAMMPLEEDVKTFKCNTCYKESRLICEHCGNENTIKANNVALVKAKSPYLTKLMDKLAPNLQTSEVSIKVDVVMSKVSALVIEMINSDVPDNRKQYWVKKFDGVCSELIENVKADNE